MGKHPKWNEREFCAYLLIYAAMADYQLDPAEKENILLQVNEETYKAIKAEFDSLNDNERLAILLTYKGLYYPTAARKKQIFDLLKGQFLADHQFSLLEANLFRILNKIM